jgi:hypothetical protein
VKEIRKKVRGKNNREIAAEMSSLSRKKIFVDALSELSKVTKFVFHLHKLYSVKLNPKGLDKDEFLLLETIRSALHKFTRHVPNHRSMLLTLLIQFIITS